VLDDTLKALADPTRREIQRALREGDLSAGEIAAVSHHLAVLKEAGLVTAERNGRSIVYSLDSTVFQEFVEGMMGYFGIGGKP
jgi:DNA-binding transcriptional ArsR family regulator